MKRRKSKIQETEKAKILKYNRVKKRKCEKHKMRQ